MASNERIHLEGGTEREWLEGLRPEDRLLWCEVDDCPSSICGGPHVEHTCLNGDKVLHRFDDESPCPWCDDHDGEEGGYSMDGADPFTEELNQS